MEPNAYALFFYNRGFLPFLIRLRDWLRYRGQIPWRHIPSHTGIIVKDTHAGGRRVQVLAGLETWTFWQEVITGCNHSSYSGPHRAFTFPGLIRHVPLHVPKLEEMDAWLWNNRDDLYDFIAIIECALDIPIPDRLKHFYMCSRFLLAALIVGGERFRPHLIPESPLDAMLITLRLSARHRLKG